MQVLESHPPTQRATGTKASGAAPRGPGARFGEWPIGELWSIEYYLPMKNCDVP